MEIKLEDILSILLLIIVSVLLGCQFMNKRSKKCRKKPRYTCGIEGGCEISINGPYESIEQCEKSCGNIY